jgi:hypothetical protein
VDPLDLQHLLHPLNLSDLVGLSLRQYQLHPPGLVDPLDLQHLLLLINQSDLVDLSLRQHPLDRLHPLIQLDLVDPPDL